MAGPAGSPAENPQGTRKPASAPFKREGEKFVPSDQAEQTGQQSAIESKPAIRLSEFGLSAGGVFKPEEVVMPAAERRRAGIFTREKPASDEPPTTLKDVYKEQLQIIYDQLTGYKRYVEQFGGQLSPGQESFLKLYQETAQKGETDVPGKMLESASGWMAAQTVIEDEMFLRLTASLGQEMQLLTRIFSQDQFPQEQRIREMEGVLKKIKGDIAEAFPHAEKFIATAFGSAMLGGILGGPLGAALGTALGGGGIPLAIAGVKAGLKEGKFKFSDLKINTAKLPPETQSYLDYMNHQSGNVDLIGFIEKSAKAQLVFFETLGVSPQNLDGLYAWETFRLGSPDFLGDQAGVQNLGTEWTRVRRQFLEKLLEEAETKKLLEDLDKKQEEAEISEFKAGFFRARADYKIAQEEAIRDPSKENLGQEEMAKEAYRASIEGMFRVEQSESIERMRQRAIEEAKEKGFSYGSAEEADYLERRIEDLIQEQVDDQMRIDISHKVNVFTAEQLNKEAYRAEEKAAEMRKEEEDMAVTVKNKKVEIFYTAQRQTVQFFLERQIKAVVSKEPGGEYSQSLTQIDKAIEKRTSEEALKPIKDKAQKQLDEANTELANAKKRLGEIGSSLNQKKGQVAGLQETVDKEKARFDDATSALDTARNQHKQAEQDLLDKRTSGASQTEIKTADAILAERLKTFQAAQAALKFYADNIVALATAREEIAKWEDEKKTLESSLKKHEIKRRKAQEDLDRKVVTGEEDRVNQLRAAALVLQRSPDLQGEKIPEVLGSAEAVAKLWDKEMEGREGYDTGQNKGYLEFLKILFDYEHVGGLSKDEQQLLPKELFDAAVTLLSPDELKDFLKNQFRLTSTDLKDVLDELKGKSLSKPDLAKMFEGLIGIIEHKGLRLSGN